MATAPRDGFGVCLRQKVSDKFWDRVFKMLRDWNCIGIMYIHTIVMYRYKHYALSFCMPVEITQFALHIVIFCIYIFTRV